MSKGSSRNKNKKKRSHSSLEQRAGEDQSSALIGVGATLAALKSEETNPTLKLEEGQSNDASADGEWTTVTRKKRKTSTSIKDEEPGSSYPAIIHSAQARLQSYVKISDLQSFVLYVFGDGNAPRWVGIQHSTAIRKVVVLMVPGLEPDMFKKTINEQQTPVKSETQPQPQLPDNPFVKTEPSASDEASPIVKPEPSVNGNASPMLSQLAEPQSTSPDDYYPVALEASRLAEPVRPFAGMFPHMWPTKSPGDERRSQLFPDIEAMLGSHIKSTSEEKNSVASGPRPPAEAKLWENKPTKITEYIATVKQLREDKYTIHPASLKNDEERREEQERRKEHKQTSEDGWVESGTSNPDQAQAPDENTPPGSMTAGYDPIAIDCEMCTTDTDRFALTRISAVRWDGTLLLDELVKPPSPITDYLTPFSGMTAAKLDPITTTLADIQSRLLPLLNPHTVLVGHSLVSDLTALKLLHKNIIDTSLLYPHPRGPPYKSSLKFLAQKYLSRAIQTGHGTSGHDSIEDARTALDLVKLKCEKGPAWGTPDARRESIHKRLGRIHRSNNPTGGLRTANVDWGAARGDLATAADVQIQCDDDEGVVDGVKRAVNGDEDGAVVPGGGVDFVFARLRTLEAVNGSWRQDRNFDMERLRLQARAKYLDDSGPAPDTTSIDGNIATTLKPQKITNSATATVRALTATTQAIQEIHASLPPTTALIVFSGALSTQRLWEYHQQQRQHKREYQTKKWDDCVRWGDEEEAAMKAEFWRVRMGMGFLGIK